MTKRSRFCDRQTDDSLDPNLTIQQDIYNPIIYERESIRDPHLNPFVEHIYIVEPETILPSNIVNDIEDLTNKTAQTDN